jgi:hypothetical protein
VRPSVTGISLPKYKYAYNLKYKGSAAGPLLYKNLNFFETIKNKKYMDASEILYHEYIYIMLRFN